MSRFILIGSRVVFSMATGVIASKNSESGTTDSLVGPQQALVGVQESGHANPSGTVRASQFQAGGAGLINRMMSSKDRAPVQAQNSARNSMVLRPRRA